MRVKETRQLSTEGLTNKIVELKNELFNLCLQLATGQLDSLSSIRLVKKDITRVKTISRERGFDPGKEV